MNYTKENNIVKFLLRAVLFTFILLTSYVSNASSQASYNSLKDYETSGALRGQGYSSNIQETSHNTPNVSSGSGSVNYITGPASRNSTTGGNYNSNYANISNAASLADSHGEDYQNGFFTVPPLLRDGNRNVAGVSVPWYKPNPKCFNFIWDAYVPSNRSLATQYFSPQLEVYNSTAVACIGYRGTTVLNGMGGCKFIGLIRVCARITPPCENGNNYCCGGSCNNQACPANYDTNNSNCRCCKNETNYRICAFEDPWDITDTKSKMPFHFATQMPADMVAGSTLLTLGLMLSVAGLFIPGIGAGLIMAGMLLMLAGGIMNLVAFIGSYINQIVIGNRGCIDYPMGPSPPPFCDKIEGSRATAALMNICSQSAQYYPSTTNNIQPSESDSPCEIIKDINTGVKKYNSFENPIVRIYFNNPLPMCSSGNTSTEDVCVTPISLLSPSDIWKDGNIIEVCASESSTNCIRLPSRRTDVGPFRPYYTLENSSSLGYTNPARNLPFSEFENLSSNSNSPPPYLEFAGIQNSDYVDVSPGNLVTIHDYDLTARKFLVRFNKSGDQLSITERVDTSNDDTAPIPTDEPIGLVDRPLMPLPTVNPCMNMASCGYANSTPPVDPATQPRISVLLGNPAKEAIIAIGMDIVNDEGETVDTAPFCYKDDYTPNGDLINNEAPCTLYSSKVFSAYLTDENNRTISTAGVNGSIVGNYNGTQYTGGLEYANNKYCRGATQICLSGYPSQNKVIAKLIDQISVDDSGNSVLQTVVSTNITDRVIPPSSPGAVASFYNPDINTWLSTNSSTRIAIGTSDPATGNFYENSFCNTEYNSCIDPNTGSYPATPICTCTASSASNICMQGCEWAFLDDTNTLVIGSYDITSGTYIANPDCSSDPNKTCSANGTSYPASTTCVCTNSSSSPPTSVICISEADSTVDNTKYTCTDNSVSPAKTTICANSSCTISESCQINGCDKVFQVPSTSNSNNLVNQGYTDGTNYYPQRNNTNTGTTYGERDANPIELGLCTNFVQPYCNPLSFTSLSASINDGYANWGKTTVFNQTTGTCLGGAVPGPNGLPTRSCIYQDNNDPDPTKNFEQIHITNIDTTESVINGCRITSLVLGPVTNPCVVNVPNWWPSAFLANNNRLQGAIFNQFNVNYDYHWNGPPSNKDNKFIPILSNSYQKGNLPERWIREAYKTLRDYDPARYNKDLIPRTHANGDEEMLFLTSDQWSELWKNNDLTWLTADQNSYNGCYVYDVSNNINADINDLTVGMKICKYYDKVSFSLVDTKKDPRTSYLNNAYIMQSNILDYYATDGSGTMTLTNNTAGRYLNHGIVIRRSGFPSNNYNISPPPTDFVENTTAESITIDHTFYSQIYAYNRNGAHGRKHSYIHTNNANLRITDGCALSVYRGTVSYQNNIKLAWPSQAYIPLYKGSSDGWINNSLVITDYTGSKGWELKGYSSSATISDYVAGNSAANKSMFFWHDINTYSACNMDPTVNQAKTCSSGATCKSDRREP